MCVYDRSIFKDKHQVEQSIAKVTLEYGQILLNLFKFFWREILSKARWNGTRGKGHRTKIDEGIGKCLRMNLSKNQCFHFVLSELNAVFTIADEISNVIGANSRCD